MIRILKAAVMAIGIAMLATGGFAAGLTPLGPIKFTKDTMFMIAGPGGMDREAHAVISVAGGLGTERPKTGGFINKVLGGVDLRAGDPPKTRIATAFEDAGDLLAASAD